jgi:predicted nucleic acid-binding protein
MKRDRTMPTSKVVIDTDLLLEHVAGTPGGPSKLRRLMAQAFCYTTVFNAVEAFGLCVTERERRAVEETMSAMKILGLNAKHGKAIGALTARRGRAADLPLLIAGLCRESRLPLVTGRPERFRGLRGLEVIRVRD